MPAEEHIRYLPEPAAVHFRAVAWCAIGTLVLLAAAIATLHEIYQTSVPEKAPPPPQVFAQPRVDTAEVEELHQILRKQTQHLETWAWANDQHTLVQVPIERAMQLLMQKSADAYAPLLPPKPALSSPTAGAQRIVTPGEIPATSAASKAAVPAAEKQP